MGGKREKPEDIVLKLRQVEVLQGQGKPLADAVRQIGVTVQTYYRWRKDAAPNKLALSNWYSPNIPRLSKSSVKLFS